MNIPKLRFKEFTDEWNYEIFDNIIDIRSKSYNPNNNINYKCIELENINQGAGTINGYFNSCEQKSTKNIFYKNEVLFGKLRPYLKKYWYATFDGVCSSEIWVAKSKSSEKITNKYILYIFQTNYFLQLCNLSTGSKMPRADWDFIKEHFFAIPTLKEQDKIVRFLSLLDKKIELQTRKIEALKLFKKGLFDTQLEKNEKELIMFDDFLDEVVEKTTIQNQYPILSSTSKGLFLQSDYFNKHASSENNIGYKILKRNQLVLSPQNLWLGNININNKFNIGIVSPSYKVYNINIKKIDLNYFNYWIKTPKALYSYLVSSEQGASIVRRNLNTEMFNQISLKVPNLKKQHILGNKIYQFDLKINLEKEMLKQLYKLKKGLMQNMFI